MKENKIQKIATIYKEKQKNDFLKKIKKYKIMDKNEKTCNSVEIREKTKKSKMIKKEKIIKNRKNGKMIF